MRPSRDSYFDNRHLVSDLRARSVRGGAQTLLSQGGGLAIRTVSTILLARLVAPEAHGLVAMVTVLIAFAALFKDLGLEQAILQRPTLTHAQVSALFWINVLVSLALTLTVALSAPLVAAFYGEPDLKPITWTVSIGFLISGIAIQHQALLRRQMHLGLLAAIEVGANLAGAILGVVTALASPTYWALLAAHLGILATRSVGLWWACTWRPGSPRRAHELGAFLSFGANVTGFNLVNFFSRNLDNILIGRFVGAETLGWYSKAYSLIMLPIHQIRTPLMNVGMPGICALRDHPERYARYYRSMMSLLALCSMPLMAYLFLVAEPLILTLLGPAWAPSVDLFRILAVAGFAQTAASAGRGLPMLSMGHSRRYLHFGVVQALATCTAMAIGIRWGATGVAIGYAVAFYLLLGPSVVWCLNDTPVRARDWVCAVWRSAVAAVGMVVLQVAGLAGWSTLIPLPPPTVAGQLGLLTLQAVVAVVLFVGLMAVLPGGRGEIRLAVSMIKQVTTRNKAP